MMVNHQKHLPFLGPFLVESTPQKKKVNHHFLTFRKDLLTFAGPYTGNLKSLLFLKTHGIVFA